MNFASVPLVPRNPDGILRVLILGRISTVHQDIENIDASYRYVEDHLKQIYQGPIKIKYLGEQASGMRTDRVTIMEAEDAIATGAWDLVITEDLSRIYRNPRFQYEFVQDAKDQGTRVICIGDNLDTADENWEVNMGAATLRHGLHIPDTRRRVRRTATNAFNNGGMVQKTRYGYRKLTKEEAGSGQFGASGLRMCKVAECTPIIQKMKDLILAGQTYAAVGDWLNDEEIKPGPYATSEHWTGKLVEDLLRDPILSGTRTFRDVLHEPIFKTGKHKRLKNPNGPEMKVYPELAHLTPEVHKELLAVMDLRKKRHPQQKEGKDHPLFKRPRSHTLWPGQHMTCAICSGLLYWGFKEQLKCQNSYQRESEHCWNHVQVSAEQVRTKVLDWLLGNLDSYSGFREALIDATWEEYARTLHRSRTSERAYEAQICDLEKQSANLVKAVTHSKGEIEPLVNQLKEVNQALANARKKKKEEQDRLGHSPCLGSRQEFASQCYDAILELSRTSYGFKDLMCLIMPVFVIQPVQALDSDLVRPRAKVTLRLSALVKSSGVGEIGSQMTGDVDISIDLFDSPEHIKHLRACRDERAKNPNHTLREISATLQIGYMTVKRAFDYYQLMQQAGLQDPYRELHDEPANASRWKKRDRQPLEDGEARAS